MISDDIIEFLDDQASIKKVTRINFIFKTIWEFLARFKSEQITTCINMFFDFDRQFKEFLGEYTQKVRERDV